ncbi:hypothetical protein [Gemmatimonas sp.]
MTGHAPLPTREEVLDAFAVEPNHGREILERYLRTYPAFAADLVDLSLELSRPVAQDTATLSPADAARVDAAWLRHSTIVPSAAVAVTPSTEKPGSTADPFASLSVEDLRRVAGELGVPRQVVTAFRERRVDVASVPRAFLSRMARAVHSTIEAIVATLSQPSGRNLGWSFKSDTKPSAEAPVPFERLLRDAGISDAEYAALLREED